MKIAPSILRTNRTIYLQKLLSKLIFLFDGYYFESWINGLSKEEGIILFWMAYQGSESNLLFLKERSWKEVFDLLRKKDFEDYRKRKTVISIIRGRKFVVLLRLVSPITANSTEERKRRKEWVGRERERERDGILVPRLRRGQRIVEQRAVDPLVTRYCLVNLASCLG